MNILSRILIVAFISIFLQSISAQGYDDSVNKDRIVKVIVDTDIISIPLKSIYADVQSHTDSINTEGIVKIQGIDGNKKIKGTGFFVGPHTLITNFHVVHAIFNSRGEISDELFIVHPKTGKRIPVHSIQALDVANDLAVLYISEYESSVYYEFAEGSPEEEVYIVDHREEPFSILEGKLSPQYAFEIGSRKALSLSNLDIKTGGLSGSSIFSRDDKVIGVFNTKMEADILSFLGMERFLNIGFFTEAQKVKELLAQPSLNCMSSACIADALRDASKSKEGQYARALYELSSVSESTSKLKDLIFEVPQRLKVYLLLKKSAKQGFPPAMFGLAYFHLNEPTDEELFEEWMNKAAENNFGSAQLVLSAFLLKRKGNVEEGIRWAQKAMEHGLFLPLDIFDYLVIKTVISKQDYRQYVEDFAERGHPEAQEERALYMLKEAQSDRDRAKAMNLLKQAKYLRVVYQLSLIYKKGLYGIEQDLEQARSLEEKAIELGYVPRDRQLVHKLIERGDFLNLDALENLVTEEIISDQEYRYYVKDSAERGYVKAQRKQIYFFLSEVNVGENEIDEAVDYAMDFLKDLNYAKVLINVDENEMDEAAGFDIVFPKELNYGKALYKLSEIYTGKVGRGLKNKAIELGYVEDEEVSDITSRVRSAVDKISLSCQKAFGK